MEEQLNTDSLISPISRLVGTDEAALRLLFTVLTGYPLALVHRHFLYGKSIHLQHLFFILTGFTLGYLNYGCDIFHFAFAVLFSYLTLVIFRGNEVCVAITFVFNMVYLLTGYYYASTTGYDINWTLPQCVLVLRLIGTAFDHYDGTQPDDQVSAQGRQLALKTRPNLAEYCAHMFFPASFLVGPQFPLRRYRDFVSGEFSDTEDKSIPPNCVEPALRKFALGFGYLMVNQLMGLYVSDEWICSDEFGELAFWKRFLVIGVWGRFTLYKYIGCWLLTEGACIMFGITHNGKDKEGVVKWDGLANVNIWRLETATEFNHYIQSFNCNTNLWIAHYVYKRLKFMGNRLYSQGAALVFLAVWHGFHTGYYVCFLFEFLVMYLEKDVQDVFKKYSHLNDLFKSETARTVRYLLLRLYTFSFMGWCLMPFGLLTFERYWRAFANANYMGIVLYILWPVLYAPLLRTVARATRPRPEQNEHAD